MSELTHYFKHELKMRYFEGWISSLEFVTKDDGSCYCSFSLPLKQKKEDNPDWLNCRVYGTALACDFVDKCKKGARVFLSGSFKVGTNSEGKEYTHFIVKNYQLLEEPKPKTEQSV